MLASSNVAETPVCPCRRICAPSPRSSGEASEIFWIVVRRAWVIGRLVIGHCARCHGATRHGVPESEVAQCFLAKQTARSGDADSANRGSESRAPQGMSVAALVVAAVVVDRRTMGMRYMRRVSATGVTVVHVLDVLDLREKDAARVLKRSQVLGGAAAQAMHRAHSASSTWTPSEKRHRRPAETHALPVGHRLRERYARRGRCGKSAG